MTPISIGVCAYNEEKNILHTLESIISQRLDGFELSEVIVVSSGSTDRTDKIVRDFALIDPRIILMPQAKREGKNSAVNLFISSAVSDVLVLVNADNTLPDGSLQKLLEPLRDPKIGIVGGHPVPVNSKDTIPGFAVHMLWDMHHRLSLIYPKIGELVAFRKSDVALPTNMQSDEDIIRMDLERKGFRPAYAPDAIVFNKGPTTIRDFLKQRTRVNIGERYMKNTYDYGIPTQDPSLVIAAFTSFLKDNRSHLAMMTAAMALEAAARMYAMIYVAMDKGDKTVWNQVSSTKDVAKRE